MAGAKGLKALCLHRIANAPGRGWGRLAVCFEEDVDVSSERF